MPKISHIKQKPQSNIVAFPGRENQSWNKVVTRVRNVVPELHFHAIPGGEMLVNANGKIVAYLLKAVEVKQ